jgi:hypothetical protein
MPIEIKELHIRIHVSENAETENSQSVSQTERDKLIETCVEQVMEILSKKQER